VNPKPQSLTPSDGSRGYTGHEMLDDLGLVHMNGRIYDPLLGRFLSADIKIQNPLSLQSYNRYSYMMDNPLSGVDLDGFEASMLNNALSGAWAGLANLAISTAQGVKFAATHGDPITAAAFKYVPALSEFSKGMDKAAEDMKQAASDNIVSVTGADNQTSHVFAQSAVLTEFGAGLATGSAVTRTEQTAVAAEKQVTQVAENLSGEAENVARIKTAVPETNISPQVKPTIDPATEANASAKGIGVNSANGAAAENLVAHELGDSVKGRNVAVNTDVGQRKLDILADEKGTLTNVEVKYNGATRNSSQVAKDKAMASTGGTPTGKNAPANLKGEKTVIQTRVRVVTPEELEKWRKEKK